MPPSIKCRTCKLAKKTFLIEPVEKDDQDAKTVNYLRVGVVIVLLAVAAIFW